MEGIFVKVCYSTMALPVCPYCIPLISTLWIKNGITYCVRNSLQQVGHFDLIVYSFHSLIIVKNSLQLQLFCFRAFQVLINSILEQSFSSNNYITTDFFLL